MLKDYIVNEFLGLNTRAHDAKSLKKGESQDSLNWLTGTKKDNIQLRMGTNLLGTTRQTDVGKITGLGIGIRADGTQVPFYSHGKKLKYYNAATDDTAEIGTDILGAAANGEDTAMATYANIAGNWMYVSSPNSSMFKLAVSSPGSYIDQNPGLYRGLFTIDQSRMFLWNYVARNTGFSESSTPHLSYIDHSLLTDYTAVTAEVIASGDGATKTFTRTLTNQSSFGLLVYGQIGVAKNITAITNAVQAKITAVGHGFSVGDEIEIAGVGGMTQINGQFLYVVSVVDADNITVSIDSTTFTTYTSGGTAAKCEFFVDDRNGNLISNLGGTGTINYVSGALSVTFFTAPISGSSNIALNYSYESQPHSITDFSFSSPRTTGQGDYFAQYGGGKLMSIFPFNGVEYCFHLFKTWALTIPADDTQSTDFPYRTGVGIPYWRAGVATDDSVVYVDYLDKTNPMIRQLALEQYSTNVSPQAISDNLDLSNQGFDYPVVSAWGNYYLVWCQNVLNSANQPFNGVSYLYNKVSGQWDKLNVGATCSASYNGTLLIGDTQTNNVFTLFSGYDDDGSAINNYYVTGQTDCEVEGMKRAHRFLIDGFISLEQSFDIYAAYDSSTSFVKVGTISGNGSYVDQSQIGVVGADTVGSVAIGNGQALTAFHFRNEFHLNSPKFEYVTFKFVATGIGPLQINEWGARDLRYKGRRTIQNYESTN